MSTRATADDAVTDVAERSRYEIRLDGELAGFLDYAPRPGRLDLTHAEVNPEFGGRGVGTRLVRAALDDVRHRGGLVRPLCPFVAEFVERNPDYADLVFAPAASPVQPEGHDTRA